MYKKRLERVVSSQPVKIGAPNHLQKQDIRVRPLLSSYTSTRAKKPILISSAAKGPLRDRPDKIRSTFDGLLGGPQERKILTRTLRILVHSSSSSSGPLSFSQSVRNFSEKTSRDSEARTYTYIYTPLFPAYMNSPARVEFLFSPRPHRTAVNERVVAVA